MPLICNRNYSQIERYLFLFHFCFSLNIYLNFLSVECAATHNPKYAVSLTPPIIIDQCHVCKFLLSSFIGHQKQILFLLVQNGNPEEFMQQKLAIRMNKYTNKIKYIAFLASVCSNTRRGQIQKLVAKVSHY